MAVLYTFFKSLSHFKPVNDDVFFGSISFRTIIFLFCSLLFTNAAIAQVETNNRRIALVIGNSLYDNVEDLANPVNDSRTMRKKLKERGFEVFGGDDLNISSFKEVTNSFKQEAQTSSTVLIYFSGHAFQLSGYNYLVPSDAVLTSKDQIQNETIRLDKLISDVQGRGRQVLVFLDACRNNPLPPSQRSDDGLTQVAVGNDIFVAFATQPGNLSYDGNGDMSPFTRAISENIATPDQSISDLMIKVRNSVERVTLYQQTPWDQSSLKKQFYFNPISQLDNVNVADTKPVDVSEIEISALQRSTPINLDNDKKPEPVTPAVDTAALPAQREENVIIIDEAPVEIFGKENLVTGVQKELKRIGCYRSDIDGVWGSGSRNALIKYYSTKKLKPTDTNPTEFHLQNLKLEEGIICKYTPPPKPRIVRKKNNSNVVNRTSSRRARNQNTNRNFQAAQTPPPAKKNSLADVKILGGLR